MKLVMYPTIDGERAAKIVEAAGEMMVVNCTSPQHAAEEITDADGFFGKMTPELLALAKQLKWLQTPTASLESHIFPALVEHPCVLTNMRGLFSDVIADHVFAYILCFARNLHLYIRNQIEAKWEPVGGEESRSTFETGPAFVSAADRAHLHVSDLTLGIVGLGAIGQEIARRGVAFGMQVLAVDPIQKELPDGVDELWGLDRLDDLLRQSDFVVIAAPHTPRSEGMFQQPQFQQMKASGYLINIGRGAIVSLDDLTSALENKEIAGAALDVFEIEPLPPTHPLWKMENVIITPHVAANSIHIAERHLATLLENVRRFASGQPLLNVADKRNWF